MEINELIKKDLHSMINKFMSEEGIEKYVTQIEGQTGRGDNYMADVIFIKITSTESVKVYNLVMKTAKRSEEFRNNMPAGIAYEREIFAYSVVFSEFEKLIQEARCDLKMDFVPNFYWKESEFMHETLFLENMKSKGYELWDRTAPWSLDQSFLAMKTFGKFHGLSFALKNLKPSLFEELSKNLFNVESEFEKGNDWKQFYDEFWTGMFAMLKTAGRNDLLEKFKGFDEYCTNFLIYHKAMDEDKLVICHGDSWNNNFMFKFKDEKADKLCILDFQLLSFDSPLKDICYNIYATCNETGLDNFDRLIETYYRSMSDTVKDLGSNLEDVFSFDDLNKHLNKFAKYGLVAGILIIKMCLASKTEAIDLEEQSKLGKDLAESFTINISDESEFHRRSIYLLEHYAKRFM